MRTKNRRMAYAVVFAMALTAAGSVPLALANAEGGVAGSGGVDLAELSLEELMNIEVYSASKKKQKLTDAAAAVYVLTNEDIRRSGATNIPEALRVVPGVEVARIDANNWAITIRGFNDRFANKLLVLIDGRSVYTPLFAGVYWDVQDVLLEDVDRIEVVRGPGGTLWGANAVNGVINIITKRAEDSQGLYLTGGGGSELQFDGAGRWGGKVGDDVHYRGYAKYFKRDSSVTSTGADGQDDWDQGRGGFRAEWEASERDEFTFQGDIYQGSSSNISTTALLDPPYFAAYKSNQDFSGGNFLARWTRELSDSSNLVLQAYYDRTHRKSTYLASPGFRADRDTVDLEFQHQLLIAKRNDVVWGLDARVTADDLRNDFRFGWSPRRRDLWLVSGFVQDEISMLEDRLRLTLGIKLEYNTLTTFEYQPNVRLLWKVHEKHTLWSAISRAVRTPSRSEDDIRLNTQVLPPQGPPLPPLPILSSLLGDRDYKSEKLLAFELGYRTQPIEKLSLDITGFYNSYDDLRTVVPRVDPATGLPVLELESDPEPLHLVNFADIGNGMEGSAWGVEIAADFYATDYLRLRAGYSYLDIDLELSRSAQLDPLSLQSEGASPHNQAFARWMLDLPGRVQADAVVRYVDNLGTLGISSYTTADVHVSWKPIESVELTFIGRDLFDAAHPEFTSSALVGSVPTRVQRSFFGSLTWRY
ncbi:MAG: TonB-dependent receptor [Candidatus Binatia bacterium]